jgi:hypothetical protein
LTFIGVWRRRGGDAWVLKLETPGFEDWGGMLLGGRRNMEKNEGLNLIKFG